MRVRSLICGIGAVLAISIGSSLRASVIFDNFNTDEGHFTSNIVGGSGSSNGFAATSSHSLDTTTSEEGAGSQKLSLDLSGTTARLRHLSGAGSAANNVAFTTSSGTDGWIGFYAKTSSPGWDAQIWIEGPSNNGSIQKTLNADGNWHLYEWNLDDTSGGADGWGSIPGIVSGVAAVADGSHTIDSIIFRNGTTTAGTTNVINIDFVAKSDSGSIAALVPEPASLGLLGVAGLGLLRRRRRA